MLNFSYLFNDNFWFMCIFNGSEYNNMHLFSYLINVESVLLFMWLCVPYYNTDRSYSKLSFDKKKNKQKNMPVLTLQMIQPKQWGGKKKTQWKWQSRYMYEQQRNWLIKIKQNHAAATRSVESAGQSRAIWPVWLQL